MAKPVGGIVFFSSLLFLLILGALNARVLTTLYGEGSLERICLFAVGIIVGIFFASKFIKEELSVLIHEYKHGILSNLVGNKWKGMKVKEQTGHFQYSYTKDTKAYNAFISLAPYYLPLFTIPSFLVGIPLLQIHTNAYLLFISCGYGADLILNYRDIAPYQTDFSKLIGGYTVGLIYVFAMNLVIFTIIFSWVLLDFEGIKQLGLGLFYLFYNLFGNDYNVLEV